jgi:hypothetical protein
MQSLSDTENCCPRPNTVWIWKLMIYPGSISYRCVLPHFSPNNWTGARINIRAKSAMQKRWDFHDDNLFAVNMIPPRKKGALATVQIDLRDDSTGAAKRLTVAGCANIRVTRGGIGLTRNAHPPCRRFAGGDFTMRFPLPLRNIPLPH